MNRLDKWESFTEFIKTLHAAEVELRNRRLIKEAEAVKDAYKIIVMMADEMYEEGGDNA